MILNDVHYFSLGSLNGPAQENLLTKYCTTCTNGVFVHVGWILFILIYTCTCTSMYYDKSFKILILNYKYT